MINIDFDYSKVSGSTPLHNKFKKQFMIAASKQYPDITILPYDVAFVRAYSEPDKVFQVGQPGVPDTIVLGCGWYLFLDMKTGRARLQPNQKAFRDRITQINYGVIRVYKINTIRQGLNLIDAQESK